MKSIRSVLVLTVFCLNCWATNAQTFIGSTPWPPDFYKDAGTLLGVLERPKDSFQNIGLWGQALAYVMAIRDESSYTSTNAIEVFKSNPEMQEKLKDPGTRTALAGTFTCIGTQVSQEQVEAVVVKYIKDNPASWHLRATVAVKKALQTSFPCNPDLFLAR